MRIAYISYEYPPDTAHGGIATYVAQAARTMVRRGHEVEVFSASPHRQETVVSGGVVENFILAKNYDEFAKSVTGVFTDRHRAQRFDVLEATEWQADARFAAAQAPDVALVVKMHTPTILIDRINKKFQTRDYPLDSVFFSNWLKAAIHPESASPWIKRLARFYSSREHRNELYQLEREFTLTADIVAPLCSDLSDFAVGYWGGPRANVRLLPNPYAANEGYLAIPSESKGKVVGFVGRLERRKGIEIFANAIPRILDADPSASVRLVGQPVLHVSGQLYDEWLRRRLRKYMSRIEILGKVPLDKMHEVYAGLDICVFPSIWENFPNVCLEAMSAGRAIVASDGGGMREMLDNGRCGSIVPSGDYRSLASAVVALLQDVDQRNRFGAMARERVLAAYHPDVIGKMMEDVYQEAIRRARVRRHDGC
jgi:glycosyltransferase involved in cell wall biosynthesis